MQLSAKVLEVLAKLGLTHQDDDKFITHWFNPGRATDIDYKLGLHGYSLNGWHIESCEQGLCVYLTIVEVQP